MKKFILLVAACGLFAGCALLSPYTITFTTPDGSVVNPATDTLDLAINTPALAYISGVTCGDQEPMAILPILSDDMKAERAHNLDLGILTSQEPGTKCEITVTAFDNTTTSNSRAEIDLYVISKPAAEVEVEEVAEETEAVEDTTVEETEAPELCDDGTVCPLEETTTDDEPTDTEEPAGTEEPTA